MTWTRETICWRFDCIRTVYVCLTWRSRSKKYHRLSAAETRRQPCNKRADAFDRPLARVRFFADLVQSKRSLRGSIQRVNRGITYRNVESVHAVRSRLVLQKSLAVTFPFDKHDAVGRDGKRRDGIRKSHRSSDRSIIAAARRQPRRSTSTRRFHDTRSKRETTASLGGDTVCAPRATRCF